MPLSSKLKTARHRERVNADPAARAEYLARRRESYQRRKQQGKICYVKSSELQEREKKKQREKWKAASKAYRDRKKMANPVLDLTPPSMESNPPALFDVVVAPDVVVALQGNVDLVDPTLNDDFSPPVVSTPMREERKSSSQKLCRRLQKEKRILKIQVLRLRKQLMEMRKLKEKSRKCAMRLMEKQKQAVSEKIKQKAHRRLAAERKQAVTQFLSRDENSFLLPGKKDTITKNKQKVQRRVLTKPLTELHKLYQTEVEQHLSMSYRQFARHRPISISLVLCHSCLALSM
ncbi:uncharacterized protein LOC132887622 [Neoarius graeffei]|uniref:uncharacterized protein LOC132887622 n=1 Tax=Neoarius graeffei TaxID=443677 RepID=UPI00298BF6CF|nr:uncharacterized protein LOC132887622 [Neoarius graeffei]